MTHHKDLADLSLEELHQELDVLDVQDARLQQRIQDLKSNYSAKEKIAESRRRRFLPYRHPDDTKELEHCVNCGLLLREWFIEYDQQEGRSWRKGVKMSHGGGAFEEFGGLRCFDCNEALMNAVLDMLEGFEPDRKIRKAEDLVEDDWYDDVAARRCWR